MTLDFGQALPESAWPRLSVVVPCYNEAENLDELHHRVSSICHKEVGDSYEFVLVDDGSTDSSRAKIDALAGKDPHIVGVHLSRNHGHQLALSAGLSLCSGARVLILDADLQDPPELLPEMMRLMNQGADVVYGRRTVRHGETRFKRATATLFYRLLTRLVSFDLPSDTGDFRLISRRVLNCLNAMPEKHRFIRGMVSWVGFQQVPIHYERQQRFAGETKYPLRKMVHFAVDAITSFSILPLRIASLTGLLFAFMALNVLAYSLYRWMMGNVVEGWTSVVTVVLVLGSAQLIVLGVMGEYLGRLYMEAKGRPMFIIDRVIRSGGLPMETTKEGFT